MQTVEIEREKLLDVVMKNRLDHIKQYNDTVKNYKKLAAREFRRMESELAKNLKEFGDNKTLKINSLSSNISPPVSYEPAYDKVIRMLELTSSSKITLTSAEFEQYVMDDWQWKKSFTAYNSGCAVAVSTL